MRGILILATFEFNHSGNAACWAHDSSLGFDDDRIRVSGSVPDVPECLGDRVELFMRRPVIFVNNWESRG